MYDTSLALIANQKFQLHIAHEFLINANDNDPGVVAAALKHTIANGGQSDIVKAVCALKEMVANADSYKTEVIERCALVLIDVPSIDDDLVKSMAGLIVANAIWCNKRVVVDYTAFIVRNDHRAFS